LRESGQRDALVPVLAEHLHTKSLLSCLDFNNRGTKSKKFQGKTELRFSDSPRRGKVVILVKVLCPTRHLFTSSTKFDDRQERKRERPSELKDEWAYFKRRAVKNDAKAADLRKNTRSDARSDDEGVNLTKYRAPPQRTESQVH